MTFDVVVVGGGPTGMMVAAELRLAGVHVIVLERLREPTGLSKALGLNGRAVDTLRHRGLLERLVPEVSARAYARFAHFGGLPLDAAAMGEDAPEALPVRQARVEEVLEARAQELGAEIRRGHEVLGLSQDDDAVALDVRGPEGEYRLYARFVVGGDGAHSTVRALAGIDFPGLAPTRLFRFGDVVLAEGIARGDHFVLPSGRRIPFGVGVVPCIPLGDGLHRVVISEPHPADFDRNAPMTLEELQRGIRAALGEELPIREARWLSRFSDASRQAERYRRGRVLLVGDAAHAVLPAGGPGLGTGLQDAANLGWKLALTVRGIAPAGLLDTYHGERHREGARVVMHTRAQGALMVDDARVAALRSVFQDLLSIEAVRHRLVRLVHATDTRYDMGDPAIEARPTVGTFAPNLSVVTARGPQRFAELMRRARGVLLDLGGTNRWRDVAAGHLDRVDVVSAQCDAAPAPALLVRPDGYVAWAAPAAGSGAEVEAELARALATWFGPPRPFVRTDPPRPA